LIPNTPRTGGVGSTTKRKSTNFETPASKATKSHPASSPGGTQTPDTISTTNFADRANAGDIISSLNGHIPESTPADTPSAEPRIKLKANTDMIKYGYKTMGMKINEASEILDDRVDEFTLLVQDYHKLEDSAFGNPSRESQSEIIAVGRIASDSPDGKLNPASLVLETSRRMTGVRVPLKVDHLPSFDFFRGKIVALRGSNASGDFFTVSEVLSVPLLGASASLPSDIDAFNARIRFGQDEFDDARPLSVLLASGPYTTDSTLDFSAFHALLAAAETQKADTLILSGPFLDTEHPLVRSGEFELPANFPVEPDKATLNDLFKYHITKPLIALTQALPGINIILVPSVRDTVAKHAAWPQDRFAKKDLGLPRQVSVVTNPITISLNEMVFGISSQDIVEQLRASQIVGGKTKTEDFYARACRQVIEQRHYFPVFPPADRLPNPEGSGFETVGASLDISYLKLGEIFGGRPDFLILPSALGSFIKVCILIATWLCFDTNISSQSGC
jgi:DNA polymerase alpha subunit B